MIRPYSISIDDKEIEKLLADNDFERPCEQLKKELRTDGKKIFVGVDRIDYTKGIPERLLAFERFIEKHPELKEKVIFIQVGAGSRIHVNTYKKINQEIDELVENINWKHATSDWKPIIFLRGQYSFKETMAYFRIADVGVVSSLHDGMNLVAKEFVVTCKGKKGVLVLSNFTGAARELTDAILINPYDREQFSEALYQAYSMPEGEQLTRLSRMQRIISENNVYTWAIKVLKAMEKFEFIRGGN
jgi:trehalose 6-phosphate synthase